MCLPLTINQCLDQCGCSITPAPTPTPGGPCCIPRGEEGGTGCDDDACEACVCGRDEPCCTNIWDATCVSRAQSEEECAASCPCGTLPTPTPTVVPTPGGDCCEPHGGASCDDSACRDCVCALDDPCCTDRWDDDCVSRASLECAADCPCPGMGDCCAPHDGIGCDDATCKNCVCGMDEACCGDEEGEGWDAICVDRAIVECAASCTCEVAGSCCEEHLDTVGCDDGICQDCVCGVDPECCDAGWDGRCVEIAATDCTARCAGCKAGCCAEHSTAGCSDGDCEACVCGEDEVCCDPEGAGWDGICRDLALGPCASPCQCDSGTPCAGDCNGSGDIGIAELITCVNIALGTPGTCTACDVDGMGGVAINELISAVNAALFGCPA